MDDLHPVVAQILTHRGLSLDAESMRRFFTPSYDMDLPDPYMFLEMPAVVARLEKAKECGELIGIYGDYDVDGVCGAALLHEALSLCKLTTIPYIPHKKDDGHGLSMRAVEFFAARGCTLIITVDCGTSSIAEIDAARSRGMDTIVVDHHHVPVERPAVVALINPKDPKSGYDFSHLCGTGTAFVVARAVVATLSPDHVSQLKWLLDLVAIGTVADCMPLVGENRTLVYFGLIVLSKVKRPGIFALIERAGITWGNDGPTAETIGFGIAPRINAAGRMAHAKTAFELLTASTIDDARPLADVLEEYNMQRRRITEDVVRSAREMVNSVKENSFSIVASDAFHLGVVGLAAGRLADALKRPVGVFTIDGEMSTGSFRSYGGIDLMPLLTQCSAEGLLVRFGGHAQAAGATVYTRDVERFAQRMDVLCRERAQGQPAGGNHNGVDAEIVPHQITARLVRDIARCAPFGNGNALPLFRVRNLPLTDVRAIGKNAAHLKARVPIDTATNNAIDVIGFGKGGHAAALAGNRCIDVVGHLEENVFGGRRSLQLRLVELSL